MDAQFVHDLTRLVVIHHQQGPGHRGVPLETVKHLFLQQAGGAPFCEEGQRHQFSGSLSFQQFFRGERFNVDGPGRHRHHQERRDEGHLGAGKIHATAFLLHTQAAQLQSLLGACLCSSSPRATPRASRWPDFPLATPGPFRFSRC